MYILCLVKDETRPGQRKAAGKTIRHRVGIGVDRFNVMLCETTADSFVGKSFSPRFDWLSKRFDEFEVDAEHARCQLRDSLKHILGVALPDDVTIEQLDQQFHPGKCATDSSGELMFYRTLKAKYGTSRGGLTDEGDDEGDDETADKGAVILYGA